MQGCTRWACLLYTSGTGYKLPDEVENQIEAYIDNNCAGIELKTGAEVGRVYRRDDGLQDLSLIHISGRAASTRRHSSCT